jgi:hypothetical protein
MTDILCPDGYSFTGCLFGGNEIFRKPLIGFDWKENSKPTL